MSTTQPTVRRAHPALEAYRQLSQALRERVYPPGSKLPSERQLSDELGVSRATVRQVLLSLAEEGLVDAQPQRGWFVPEAVLTEPNVLMSFSELAIAQGRTPSGRLLRSETRPASLDEADRLGVAPTSPVLELERLRLLDGVVVSIDCSRVPLARAPQLADIELGEGSIYAALTEHCGLEPMRADFVVHAGPADRATAELLATEVGAPVLIGDETAFDQHDEPVLLGRSIYRCEAYRFEATLFRPGRAPR